MEMPEQSEEEAGDRGELYSQIDPEAATQIELGNENSEEPTELLGEELDGEW